MPMYSRALYVLPFSCEMHCIMDATLMRGVRKMTSVGLTGAHSAEVAGVSPISDHAISIPARPCLVVYFSFFLPGGGGV